MSDLTCKCGHAVSEHIRSRATDPICLHAGCPCEADFPALHRAIVEAAMRFEADTSNTNYEALIAAVRALREATQS